jgi:HSP20 family protein
MAFKRKGEEDIFTSMGNMLENFFNNDFFKGFTTGTSIPAVNIYEDDEGFDMEVAAPTFKKGDFQLDYDGGVLSISGEKKESDQQTDRRVTKQEFNYTSFQRSFTLPNSVDPDKISAKYSEGVLHVRLPKKERKAGAGINIDIE